MLIEIGIYCRWFCRADFESYRNSTTSVLHTIELILGAEPMSQFTMQPLESPTACTKKPSTGFRKALQYDISKYCGKCMAEKKRKFDFSKEDKIQPRFYWSDRRSCKRCWCRCSCTKTAFVKCWINGVFNGQWLSIYSLIIWNVGSYTYRSSKIKPEVRRKVETMVEVYNSILFLQIPFFKSDGKGDFQRTQHIGSQWSFYHYALQQAY